jgi:hypothetical protein
MIVREGKYSLNPVCYTLGNSTIVVIILVAAIAINFLLKKRRS